MMWDPPWLSQETMIKKASFLEMFLQLGCMFNAFLGCSLVVPSFLLGLFLGCSSLGCSLVPWFFLGMFLQAVLQSSCVWMLSLISSTTVAFPPQLLGKMKCPLKPPTSWGSKQFQVPFQAAGCQENQLEQVWSTNLGNKFSSCNRKQLPLGHFHEWW